MPQDIRAVHLEGGNFFDDMRVDIAASHRRFDQLARGRRSTARPFLRNYLRYRLTSAALTLGIHEALVMNGIKRRWLEDFRDYWSNILGGRPLWSAHDFFLLLYDYRKRQQHTSALEWNDAAQHLKNWQRPCHLYLTLHTASRCALGPIPFPPFWKHLRRGLRVLEYGCSLAPYYHCYREFLSHLDCAWTLADIPNFPFHYARYLYRDDAGVDLVTIHDTDFANPLGDAGAFDVIILTTVLEHLDDPSFVSDYLLQRLKPGGLLVFDYIKSEGKGLDHPNALARRQECLKDILARTELVHGSIADPEASVGLCIARKRPAPRG